MRLLSQNHLLTVLSISFVLTQSWSFFFPECSGLFLKYLIRRLIFSLHRNLCMGCYASTNRFWIQWNHLSTKCHCHSAASLPNSSSRRASVGIWTHLTSWLRHIQNLVNHLGNLYYAFKNFKLQAVHERAPISSNGPSKRFLFPGQIISKFSCIHCIIYT